MIKKKYTKEERIERVLKGKQCLSISAPTMLELESGGFINFKEFVVAYIEATERIKLNRASERKEHLENMRKKRQKSLETIREVERIAFNSLESGGIDFSEFQRLIGYKTELGAFSRYHKIKKVMNRQQGQLRDVS